MKLAPGQNNPTFPYGAKWDCTVMNFMFLVFISFIIAFKTVKSIGRLDIQSKEILIAVYTVKFVLQLIKLLT